MPSSRHLVQTTCGKTLHDLIRNGEGYWRRKCIADLPICIRLFTRKPPLRREPLDEGHHRNSQPGHSNEVPVRGGVSNGMAVYPEFSPGPLCPCGAEIRAAMLLTSPNNGRSNLIRAIPPRLSPLPAVCRHQIV